jgi:hypothetical protein
VSGRTKSPAFRFGVWCTTVWMFGLVSYLSISGSHSWSGLWGSSFSDFGDFLSGAIAPLAFLWFLVTTFMQREELNLQREELMKSTAALEAQSQASKIDLLFRVHEFYAERLTYHLDHIMTSARTVSKVERDRLWDLLSRGNRLIIARHFLNELTEPEQEQTVADAIQATFSAGGQRAANLTHSLREYGQLVDEYEQRLASLSEQRTALKEFIEIRERLFEEPKVLQGLEYV